MRYGVRWCRVERDGTDVIECFDFGKCGGGSV